MIDYTHYGHLEKLWARVHNLTRRVTLKVGDDSGVFQTHQTEGLPGELRDAVPRVQEFGHSTMPLPGAEGVVVANNGGYQGTGAIVATNDPRYRPKNQKPGEYQSYMVDGADSKGDNGTLRALLQGKLGWITSLLGKTINVGDNTASVTINIGTTSSPVTINMGRSNATVNITGSAGDVVIAGISLRHHTHPDPQGGNTGQPT